MRKRKPQYTLYGILKTASLPMLRFYIKTFFFVEKHENGKIILDKNNLIEIVKECFVDKNNSNVKDLIRSLTAAKTIKKINSDPIYELNIKKIKNLGMFLFLNNVHIFLLNFKRKIIDHEEIAEEIKKILKYRFGKDAEYKLERFRKYIIENNKYKRYINKDDIYILMTFNNQYLLGSNDRQILLNEHGKKVMDIVLKELNWEGN